MNEVITSPAKAIRRYCLECCRESVDEVRRCPAENCVLHHFRFGKNPFRTRREMSSEQKERMSEILAEARKKKLGE